MKDSIRERGKTVPKDVEIFVEKSIKISKRINYILKEKDISFYNFALIMNLSPSLISKWMSGTHNFTLKTISKIEAVIGEKIIDVEFPRVNIIKKRKSRNKKEQCNHDWTSIPNCVLTSVCKKCGEEDTSF